jgi:XRE family aerobic/anaerobic benzoate catabolism transcriptional regulator
MPEKDTLEEKKLRKTPAQVSAERAPRVVEAQKRLGNRIKSLREGRSLTQRELAEQAGLSEKYLGEVERGICNVTLEFLSKLAEALNIPMTAILENDHEQNREQLVAAIIRMAPELSEKDAQIAYRMLTLMTHR